MENKDQLNSLKTGRKNERKISMKNVRLMTILEAVGAFLLAFMCFGNTDNMKKCIVWGIVLIAWTAFFEVSRRAQKKKEGK